MVMDTSTNTYLQKAKNTKDDEFYTTYESVDKELQHYWSQLTDKTILCNCDDPFESNFCSYFLDNFQNIGINRLICTSFSESPIADKTFMKSAYMLDVPKSSYLDFKSAWNSGNKKEMIRKGYITSLKGDGSFQSDECLSILEKSDVVITNPPFSLFRPFISLLEEYKKKYLVIGNQNALMYKEIFPLVKDNRAWLGYNNGDMSFRVPSYTTPRKTRYWEDESGQKWRSIGNAMWFTNLDVSKRHEWLALDRKYEQSLHPTFDNYEAIYVPKVTEIPKDYLGIMAVPLTVLSKYNPDQFEIVGEANHGSDNPYDLFKPILHGKEIYKRILVRRKA